MSIGNTIKEARKNAGLTQIQLGEKVYKSAQVISNWERGYTTGITAEDIKNLSLALNVPPAKLIDEHEPPKKPLPVVGGIIEMLAALSPQKQEQAKSYIAFLANEDKKA